ncbi:hypothetical protein M3J09_007077 [Ascochyta lentis]
MASPQVHYNSTFHEVLQDHPTTARSAVRGISSIIFQACNLNNKSSLQHPYPTRYCTKQSSINCGYEVS